LKDVEDGAGTSNSTVYISIISGLVIVVNRFVDDFDNLMNIAPVTVVQINQIHAILGTMVFKGASGHDAAKQARTVVPGFKSFSE
jgi:hypothetical protein